MNYIINQILLIFLFPIAFNTNALEEFLLNDLTLISDAHDEPIGYRDELVID